MALQPANIYHKMKSAFEKIEEGKLNEHEPYQMQPGHYVASLVPN